MATTPPSVSDNIAAEMRRRKVSQTVVATHLNLSQAAISARLRGKVDWRLPEIIAVAKLLDVPLSALIPEPTAPLAGAS
jgi:predicted transcriptional regulator